MAPFFLRDFSEATSNLRSLPEMPFKLHAPQVPKDFDLEGNPKHGYLPIPKDYLIMLLDKTAGTSPVELIWMGGLLTLLCHINGDRSSWNDGCDNPLLQVGEG